MTCTCHADDRPAAPPRASSAGATSSPAAWPPGSSPRCLPRWCRRRRRARRHDGPGHPARLRLPAAPPGHRASTSGPIMFPVFPTPRSGGPPGPTPTAPPRGCGRLHQGQDLMGRKMLKLLAVHRRHHRRAAPPGRGQLALPPGRRRLVLLLPPHQQRHARHRRRLQPLRPTPSPRAWPSARRVRKGEHVAYLGDSGNAEGSGSHCHFEIRLPNAQLVQRRGVQRQVRRSSAAEPARLRPGRPGARSPPSPSASRLRPPSSRRLPGRRALARRGSTTATSASSAAPSPPTPSSSSGSPTPRSDATQPGHPPLPGLLRRHPRPPASTYWVEARPGRPDARLGLGRDGRLARSSSTCSRDLRPRLRPPRSTATCYGRRALGGLDRPAPPAARPAACSRGAAGPLRLRVRRVPPTRRQPHPGHLRVPRHGARRRPTQQLPRPVGGSSTRAAPPACETLIRAHRTGAKYAARFR